jgi:hypothetical protein
MRASFSALVLALGGSLVACGGSVTSTEQAGATGSGAGGGTGATAQSSSSASTGAGAGGSAEVPYPAPHPGMPQIPNNGGVVLHDPVIVTVTFPGDDLEAQLQKFDDEVGSLQWWSTVHAGYGVGPATGGGHVSIPDALPAAMSDTDVETWLAAQITSGVLPAPTDQSIYALYVPASTTINIGADQGGGTSCQDFLGYHDAISVLWNGATIPVAYAVINRCGDIDQVTETASHEFTEASTDPHPFASSAAYVFIAETPWTTAGGENGDMCSMVSGVTEAGWSLTRVWNNPAAAEGSQPCLPVPMQAQMLPYFNAGVVHDTLSATPGQTVTTEVDCYSFGPLPGDMTLVAQPYSKSNLAITFDKPTCTNGDKVTMTIAVSATAKKGTDYHYTLLAQLDQQNAHLWRGMVRVK